MSVKRKAVIIALLLPAACIYAYKMRDALLGVVGVFAYAAAFSLMLSPLHSVLLKRGWPDHLCAAVCIGVLMLAFLVLLISFFPYLITNTIALIRRCAPVLTGMLSRGEEWLAMMGLKAFRIESFAEVVGRVMSGATGFAARSGMFLAEQTGRIFFALVVSYYILCEKKKILNHLLLLLPISWRMPFLGVARGCSNAMMGYASGLLKTSAFIGLSTYIGLTVLGVKDALLLAFFMALFEILPYIGPVLAAIPILLSAMELGVDRAALSLGLVILVQQMESSFVGPYFTASSTSIHPLAALIGVYIFGSLMGIWGILLAIPLIVAVRSALWSVRQMTNPLNA